MIKILLDAMGGDNAPSVNVAGAVRALNADKQLKLVLTGREAEICAELAKHKYDKSRLEIVDCPDVIEMNDSPTEAVKRKQSSLMAAYWMLKKEDDICALVTAGSTNKAPRAVSRDTQLPRRRDTACRLRRERGMQARYALPVRGARLGIRAGGVRYKGAEGRAFKQRHGRAQGRPAQAGNV